MGGTKINVFFGYNYECILHSFIQIQLWKFIKVGSWDYIITEFHSISLIFFLQHFVARYYFGIYTERKNLIESKRSWPMRYSFCANEIIYLTQWYLLFARPRCQWNLVTLNQLKFYLNQLNVFAWWNVWITQVKIIQWHKKSRIYNSIKHIFNNTKINGKIRHNNTTHGTNNTRQKNTLHRWHEKTQIKAAMQIFRICHIANLWNFQNWIFFNFLNYKFLEISKLKSLGIVHIGKLRNFKIFSIRKIKVCFKKLAILELFVHSIFHTTRNFANSEICFLI